jgi:DNA-binding beta-propeller fold protein YncE
MSAPTVAAGTRPASMAIDPTGKYVYVSSDSYKIYQYIIGANGALNAMATPAFTTTTGSLPTYIL